MKIHPVGAELFHVDRRTDTRKLIVAFRNFANTPKKNGDRYERHVHVRMGNAKNRTYKRVKV